LPDRKIVNAFTKELLPPLQGRPAAIDSVELDLEGPIVWRLRAAVFAETGERIYEPLWARMKYPTSSQAADALAKMVDAACAEGYAPVPASGPYRTTGSRKSAPAALHPGRETAESLVTRLVSVPWFVNIGFDDDADDGVCRIRSFDEWPGPEDITGELLAERYGRWADALEPLGPKHEWPALDRRVREIVTARASWNVPFDPNEDPWRHPPTACVGDAAFVSALLMHYLLVQQPIPNELLEHWAWFARGHWPAAYDESSDLQGGKLIVF
jgi:hypothetical protein